MRSGNWGMYNYRWVFEWMNAHGYPIQLISFKDWKERYYYLPSFQETLDASIPNHHLNFKCSTRDSKVLHQIVRI